MCLQHAAFRAKCRGFDPHHPLSTLDETISPTNARSRDTLEPFAARLRRGGLGDLQIVLAHRQRIVIMEDLRSDGGGGNHRGMAFEEVSS